MAEGHTMKQVTFLLAFALWLMTGLIIAAGPPNDYSVAPEVIASGGQTSSSASYTVMSTLGQPAVGSGGSQTYNLCSGYWCDTSIPNLHTYLPVIRRG
jgi:hypothetical protein